MNILIAGIDDLATGQQLSEGWAFFVIEEKLSDEFSEKSAQLLDGIALNSFHGKLYKRRFKDRYIKFLQLCRDYSEKSKISLIAVVLQDLEWKKQFKQFTENIIKNVYTKNTIINQEIVLSAQKLTAPLFTLQNLTKSLFSDYSMSILIDSHNITENFNELKIEVSNDLGSTTITAKQLLSLIYNGYRKQQFPNSPKLNTSGISVKKDENSFLIQAADIIGNFSLSYMTKKLGKTSKTINEKADIFSSVFGDKFDNIDISNNIELTNTDEFKLKYNGQQTLKFGRYDKINNYSTR